MNGGMQSQEREISGQPLIGCSDAERMWKLINKYNANILSAYSNRDANSRKVRKSGYQSLQNQLVRYILF